MMADKHDENSQEWRTVYEDGARKILARGDDRRAIDASTGRIIIEYSSGAMAPM